MTRVSPQIPRQAVISGFSVGSGFDMELKKDSSGRLILSPRKPWKVAFWPISIGIVLYLLEPLRRLVWILFTGAPGVVNFFLLEDAYATVALFMGVAAGGILALFNYISGMWTPATWFDQGANLILRPALEAKALGRLLGFRSRIEEVRMKISDARALQLCYGGFVRGDSDSPSFDWWQLLIVGSGGPPYRTIIAQSGVRKEITAAGRQIAKYLSVPFIDDGDFRDPQDDAEKNNYGSLNADGVFVTTGSSADGQCNPVEVMQAFKSYASRNDRRYVLILIGVVAAVGLAAVWIYYIN